MGNCPSGFLYHNKKCVYDCSNESEWFQTTLGQTTPKCNLRTDTVNGFSLAALPIIPATRRGGQLATQTLEDIKTSDPALYRQYQDEKARVKREIDSQNTDVVGALQDANRTLKPFRPPTAPASDKAIERKAILSGNRSFVFVQLALFILLAVLIAYLILPPNYANGVAFVLLCVGVAYGFFLRR